MEQDRFEPPKDSEIRFGSLSLSSRRMCPIRKRSPSGWVGGVLHAEGVGLLLWGREVRGVAPSTRVRVL